MMRLKSMFTGAGLGALMMYLFDPQRGRRRRSIARDKAKQSVRSTAHGVDVAWRDLGNRVRGRVADLRLRMNGSGVPDRVLEARVRSRIGRVVSHPRALQVTADDGSIRISGPILTREVNDLLRTVSGVPGVHEVIHQLDIHENADIPSLQGGRERPGYPGALSRKHWKPATRLIVGASGAMVGLFGLRRRGITGTLSRIAGSSLLLRATAN